MREVYDLIRRIGHSDVTVLDPSSSPVTTLNSDEIGFQGVTRIEDMLNRLPQVYADQTSTLANGATLTATVDLRGLGSERTLVLVNGRRLPSGSPQQAALGADLNQIPAALVDRVEVQDRRCHGERRAEWTECHVLHDAAGQLDRERA